MRNLVHRSTKRFIQRHALSLIAVPIASLLCVGSVYSYAAATDAKITTMNREAAVQAAANDTTLAAIKARKAAELKAQQEAAAKATAESAKTADSSTAATIDSTSCNTDKVHNDPASIDVVVNKKHCIQPLTLTPNDLVNIGGGFLLSAKAAGNYAALMAAASAAGEPLALTSSYRSYNDQVATYAYWVNVSGKDGADTYSARPGYSEHQTGLAFDVADAAKKYVLSNFKQTSQYVWLQAHAADYGFIQRYYSGYTPITGYDAEEWHYRYVGTTVAKDMQVKGIKTLEQYWNISGGTY